MSLTIIAMTGILLGFMCLMVGFFMEGAETHGSPNVPKEKKTRHSKKRLVKKAA